MERGKKAVKITLPEITLEKNDIMDKNWHWTYEVLANGFVPHYDVKRGSDIKHVYFLQEISDHRHQGFSIIELGCNPPTGYESIYVLKSEPTKIDNTNSQQWKY